MNRSSNTESPSFVVFGLVYHSFVGKGNVRFGCDRAGKECVTEGKKGLKSEGNFIILYNDKQKQTKRNETMQKKGEPL